MSKSSGEFLRLQLLIDRGYHPLAYRLMCLQAHYRSELEFSWEGLGAALTRLKRMVQRIESLKSRHAELVSASMTDPSRWAREEGWTLKQVQGDEFETWSDFFVTFDASMSDDLGTPLALTVVEDVLGRKKVQPAETLKAVSAMDAVLGLNLMSLTRADLRIRPKSAAITEHEIEAALARRKDARAAKDFAASDAIRDELASAGVEVMDGDPLGWEWKLS
jgi:cysteinyl-tRNA synthetase